MASKIINKLLKRGYQEGLLELANVLIEEGNTFYNSFCKNVKPSTNKKTVRKYLFNAIMKHYSSRDTVPLRR
jgi:hypothetical protein